MMNFKKESEENNSTDTKILFDIKQELSRWPYLQWIIRKMAQKCCTPESPDRLGNE